MRLQNIIYVKAWPFFVKCWDLTPLIFFGEEVFEDVEIAYAEGKERKLGAREQHKELRDTVARRTAELRDLAQTMAAAIEQMDAFGPNHPIAGAMHQEYERLQHEYEGKESYLRQKQKELAELEERLGIRERRA